MTIQIARRIGRALKVRSATSIREIDLALQEYVRTVPKAAGTPVTGTIDASQVATGTLPDARVAQSNVTQHEVALSIDWLQLDNVPLTFTPAAHTHGNADLTGYTAADVLAKLLTVDGAGSGLDADLLDGVQLAAISQLAAAETMSGQKAFSTGRIDSNSAAGMAALWFSTKTLADDATDTFAVPRHGIVAVITPRGGTIASHGLFWVASGAETTGSINVGGSFSLGTTANPDIDGNTNAWMSGAATLSVKNRFGASRDITVVGLGAK